MWHSAECVLQQWTVWIKGKTNLFQYGIWIQGFYITAFQDFLGQMFCTLGEIVGSQGSRLEKSIVWVCHSWMLDEYILLHEVRVVGVFCSEVSWYTELTDMPSKRE